MPARFWYGQLGSLVPLPGNSAGDDGQEDNASHTATAKTGLSGTRLELSRSRTRVWPITIPSLSPSEEAVVAELVDGEFGIRPHHWVPIWAAQQNLFTKEASRFAPGTWTDAPLAQSGPLLLDAGEGVWPTSAVRVGDRPAYSPVVPVLAGEPVTGSCYLTGESGNPRAELRFVDVANRDIAGAAVSGTSARGARARRSVVTAIAPMEAAGARLVIRDAQDMAAPCITWSPAALERAVGIGCGRAFAHSLTRSRRRRTNNGWRVDVAFTVEELS